MPEKDRIENRPAVLVVVSHAAAVKDSRCWLHRRTDVLCHRVEAHDDERWRLPMFGMGALSVAVGKDMGLLLREARAAVGGRPDAGAATGPSANPSGGVVLVVEACLGDGDPPALPAGLLDRHCVVVFLWPAENDEASFAYAISHPDFCRVPDAVLDAIECHSESGHEASATMSTLVAMCRDACVLGRSALVTVPAVVADAAHKAGILGKYGS